MSNEEQDEWCTKHCSCKRLTGHNGGKDCKYKMIKGKCLWCIPNECHPELWCHRHCTCSRWNTCRSSCATEVIDGVCPKCEEFKKLEAKHKREYESAPKLRMVKRKVNN